MTGHDLAKGADRFEERSKSSDRRSAQKNRKGELTIQQIRRGVSVQPAAAGLMSQALTWHWRVPMVRARAVAVAS